MRYEHKEVWMASEELLCELATQRLVFEDSPA
jgi:hypothetical protein